MSYNIVVTDRVKREFKKLSKKYPSVKEDFANVLNNLDTNPTSGTPLGMNCYKIRFAIKSKNKGKSGGARMITHSIVVDKIIYIIDIYDKSEKDNITDKELIALLELLA